jgi:hypothetical protein
MLTGNNQPANYSKLKIIHKYATYDRVVNVVKLFFSVIGILKLFFSSLILGLPLSEVLHSDRSWPRQKRLA